MAKTRVMIVDDQFIARQLFEMYLKSSENYELACVAKSASFADSFSKTMPVDLILMDILMGDSSNGLDAAAKIKKIRPNIKNNCCNIHAGGVVDEEGKRDRHRKFLVQGSFTPDDT